MITFAADVVILPQSRERDDVLLYRAGKSSLRLRREGVDVVAIAEQIQAGWDDVGVVGLERAWFGELLERLKSGGFLASDLGEHDLPEQVRARFERLLAYFSAFETAERSRFTYLRRLQGARVAVVGLGSLGSWVTMHLASNAIGEVHGVDGDIVELSNLSRQILYRTDDVGRVKAEAARRTVESYTTETSFVAHPRRVSSIGHAYQLIDELQPDLVIMSADAPRLRIGQWWARACFERGLSMLRVNALGVGPIGDGRDDLPCSQCDFKRRLAAIPNEDLLAEYRMEVEDSGPLRGPVLSTVVGVYASLAAHEAIAFLAGHREPVTRAGRLVFDPSSALTRLVSLKKDPACSVCGVGSG